MCTVTYLPKSNGFIITSNRDEAPNRVSALHPDVYFEDGVKLLYPKDPQGNGSWLALAEDERAVCLMNGGFEPHKRKDSYKHSRGLIVTRFFSYKNAADFIENYDFSGVEPFTLVIAEFGKLYELRWDETNYHLKEMDAKEPHIWSSTTLYTPEITAKREEWFAKWLKTNDQYIVDNIRKFHKFGGDGDHNNDLIMHRGDIISTVSITSIVMGTDNVEMIYEDLRTQEKSIKGLPAFESV